MVSDEALKKLQEQIAAWPMTQRFVVQQLIEDYSNIRKDLLAYKATRLTPEICANYKTFEDEAISKGVTFKRIVELMEADKDGRVVVLPCVKYCEQYRWQNITWDNQYGICAGCHNTREEAEAALEAMKDE